MKALCFLYLKYSGSKENLRNTKPSELCPIAFVFNAGNARRSGALENDLFHAGVCLNPSHKNMEIDNDGLHLIPFETRVVMRANDDAPLGKRPDCGKSAPANDSAGLREAHVAVRGTSNIKEAGIPRTMKS
jgi:hypothetical protein